MDNVKVKQVSNQVFQGTVKEFVESGLKVNGKNIDAVTLSGMGRYELLKHVGEQKPQRGRSAAIYEIDMQADTRFSF